MDYIKGSAAVATLLVFLVFLLDKLWPGWRSSHHSNGVDNASRQSDSVASASNSAYSNPLPLPIGEYEVFLNFRGPDTRYKITDILYRFLVNLKIRTFKDDDELEKGEGTWPGLVKAIKQSKVYVPIFSKNYAYSKWCLKELAVIVKHQKRNQGCIILPIFYMVDPGDVRNQDGTYKYAFEEHEYNFDEETIQGWRDALKTVGAIKGWHIESKKDQGAIADLVAGIVCSHLSKSNKVIITDKLFGINEHIEAVEERIALDSLCTTIVGIHGIGGIGKTTIAKAVYNKVFPQFVGCSFVEDVRDMLQQRDGAVILQKHIISDIPSLKKFDADVDNNSKGIGILQDRISDIKFLIVLDDVDENFELQNILGDIKKFKRGSRFIITSRNVRVLSILTDDCKLYKVKEMSDDDSLQLFCNHAFRKDSPPSNFETLSKEIVSVAAGLPLTLKVVGSLLFQEEQVIWKDKLQQLKEIPEEQVMERLRISYDTLNEEAKQIFLDIACFFIGEDKELPSYMWRDCGFFPIISINILKQRSLIEIKSDYSCQDDIGYSLDSSWYFREVFQMHDQLRDMGREIVCQEGVKHQMTESRIWLEEKVVDMLLHKKGTNRVKGIRVYNYSWQESIGEISQACFTSLSELIYLETNARMLIDGFSNYGPNLKWLRLSMGWEKCIPKFSMENLVILELIGLEMNEWGAFRDIKMATKLKVLKLSGYLLCELPEFPESLEILYLEFGFHFSDYKDLKIVILGNLKVLHLVGCGIREINGLHLFPSSLTTALIRCCWYLESLPSLQKLENLSDLFIEGCPYVKEIVGLGGLKALESLRIEGPKDVRNLDGLDSLYSLKSLSLEGCDELTGLPIMASLSKLLHLHISDCRSLTEIQGLEGLESLHTLDIVGAKSLTRLFGFETLLFLNKLEVIKIRRCPLLTSLGFHDLDDGRLSEASVVDSLRELNISASPLVLQIFCRMIQLFIFPSLTKLTLKRDVRIGNFDTDLLLDGIESMEELVVLDLYGLESLWRLPSLAKLGRLKWLAIYNAPYLLKIEGLAGLKSLEYLYISNCTSLTRLPADELYGLEQLKDVVINGCTSLFDLSVLTKLERMVKMGKS